MPKISKCTMILISEGRRCHSQIALRYSSRSGFRLAFRTIWVGSASGKLWRTQESGLGHGLFITSLGGLPILLFGCRNSMHFVAGVSIKTSMGAIDLEGCGPSQPGTIRHRQPTHGLSRLNKASVV